jgi:hypothetical protein
MENHPMENQEDPVSSNLPICLLALCSWEDLNTRPPGSQFWYFRSFLGFCWCSARKTKKLEGGRDDGREREREREREGRTVGLNLMEAEKKGRMQIGMGEVKWEVLGEGRVRCVETGHEMLESEKNFYLSTKKCRRALFDIALLQRKPPLHLFQQSPISRLSAFTCFLHFLSTVFQILFLGFMSLFSPISLFSFGLLGFFVYDGFLILCLFLSSPDLLLVGGFLCPSTNSFRK